jgi:hypothetical protein
MLCPCYSARLGAFLLALDASIAASPLLFGGVNLTAALLREWRSCGGDGRSFAILATLVLLFGLWQLVLGVREALSHDDDFSLWSFLYSVGLALVLVMYGGEATAGLPALDAAAFHALFVALFADCVINLWLLFRGVLPRRRRSYDYDPSLVSMLRGRDATIARLSAELAESGKEGAAASVLKSPGVARAILSALHPDRASSDADKRLATERFQAASAVLSKLGVRR